MAAVWLIAAQAQAAMWGFSYFDTATGGSIVQGSGTLTTTGPLTELTGNSVNGLWGYQITGMTGQRNNVTITGVQANPNFPGTSQDNNIWDNALVVNPNGSFDVDGLNFSLANGTYYNLSSYLAPIGGGTYDTITTAQVAGTLVTMSVTPVPEPTTVIAGIGALGLLLFGAGVHSKRSVLRIGM